MPVGAIIGSTVVGVGSAVASSGATKSAANKAADTSLQTTQMNNNLAVDNRNFAAARIDPFVARGNRAGDALNALLLGGPSNNAATMPASALTVDPYGTTASMAPMSASQFGQPIMNGMESYEDYGVLSPDRPGLNNGYYTTPIPPGAPQAVPPANLPATMPGAAATGNSGQDAWQQFFDSSGARAVLDEGQRATNLGYAGKGALRSGAARIALQERGQQELLSNYLLPYMTMLGQQQNVGLSGANAMAGVGTNMVNSMTANNNSAGSAAANAALMAGNANASMYGDIGAGLSRALGALGGSSYGKGK